MTLHDNKGLSLGTQDRKGVTEASRQVVSLEMCRAAKVKGLKCKWGVGVWQTR